MSAHQNTPPWGRLEGEPPRWFERFDAFRLLGPSRSIEAAWRAETGRKGPCPGRWKAEAARWRWRERAEAWDASQRPSRQKQRLDELEAERQEHLKIARLQKKKAYEALEKLDTSSMTPADVVRLLESGVGMALRALEGPALEDLQAQVDELKGEGGR